METLTRNRLIGANPANIYLFKVNIRKTRKRSEIVQIGLFKVKQ